LGAALEIARRTGNGNGELGALTRPGRAYQRQGRQELASQSYRAALRLGREVGDRNTEDEEASVPAIRSHLASLDAPDHQPAGST
jgi:hypothetical protein